MSEKSNIWNLNPNDIYSDYRRMSTSQLEIKYNDASISTIKNILRKNNFEINKKIINSDLSTEEIIFMYDSLLKGEIKSLSSGILTCENKFEYAKIIFRYLINDILKWSKEDIINNYSGKMIDRYLLKGTLLAIKFNTYDYLKLSFPEYEIKSWELNLSTVGNGFWNKENNIIEALMWLKNKLSKDKNIIDINQCGKLGFDNIIDEYKLVGLRVQHFNSTIDLFEKMYNCKYNKEEMLKINYTFDINPILNIDTKLNNKVYLIQNEYYELDDIKRTLCNEIIRFCEENNRYPSEKDMSNKNGYISRTQYSKVFGSFKEFHKYITPICNIERENKIKAKENNQRRNSVTFNTKPSSCKCIKCNIEKPFNGENFTLSNNAKFGLRYMCKKCEAEIAMIKRYNKLGIKINNIDDLSVEEWWEYMYKGTIKVIPKKFYTEQYYLQLTRYIVLKYSNIEKKCDIIEWFKTPNIKKYKISDIVYKMGGILKILKSTFPEMNFIEEDFNIYKDENILKILDNYINKNNLSTEDILNGKASFRKNKKVSALLMYISTKNKSINELLIWYFSKKNIKHPITNSDICIYDFNNKPNNFYENTENRINNIKHYCQNICEESILSVIDNTENLKIWVCKYFKQSNLANVFPCYNKYYGGLYNLLIDCYPQIKENNILFEWEWTQCGKNDINFLINMLREYVLYRMDDVVTDIIKDAPTYINIAYFNTMFSKMNKHIAKHRFKNYYEWLCLAFPEYKDNWNKEDFKIIVAKDGTELDSFEERDVYEYIQSQEIFRYIKPIGKARSGKYTFKLDESYEYERFCPDFVIEYIHKDNKKVKLSKPIILEYYGMYDENNKYIVFKNYIKKTLIKEEFYKNNRDIYYIGIYPNDIKNNYKCLAKKLGSFYLENLSNIKEYSYEAI